MTCSIGGGALDFALVVERGLMNQKNALPIIRDDPGAPAAEDLETILEPRNLGQRHSRELYDEFSLRKKEIT